MNKIAIVSDTLIIASLGGQVRQDMVEHFRSYAEEALRPQGIKCLVFGGFDDIVDLRQNAVIDFGPDATPEEIEAFKAAIEKVREFLGA